MTTIDPAHPVRRETAEVSRRRPLIVELHPRYAVLREKGRRHSVDVPYSAMLALGYKLLAKQKREEKLATRQKKG